jgi:hypothetical protein
MSDKPSFQQLSILRVDELRPHERIKSDRVEEVRRRIDEMDAVDYPILVDDQYHVILDGHHRYTALREKGLNRIPVIAVNYHEDSLVKLEARKNCPIDDLTKQDVLRKGLSPEVFPPKSTRHTLRDPIVAEDVPLDRLD